MSQIDIRAADLREVAFEKCEIGTAIVDGNTRVSGSFPVPRRLRIRKFGTTYKDEWDRESVEEWLDKRGRSSPTDRHAPALGTKRGQMLQILEQACRSSHWIPATTDTKAWGFVRNPLWKDIVSLLDECGFLHKKMLSASGPNSNFVHIRRADDILANEPADEEVKKLYEAIEEKAKARR